MWTDVDLLGSLSSHWLVFVFLLVTRDNVVDAQQQDRCLKNRETQTGYRKPTSPAPRSETQSGSCLDLYSGLVGLSFNSERLPDPQRRHVGQTAGLSIHTPTHAVVLSVFSLKRRGETEPGLRITSVPQIGSTGSHVDWRWHQYRAQHRFSRSPPSNSIPSETSEPGWWRLHSSGSGFWGWPPGPEPQHGRATVRCQSESGNAPSDA